MPLVERLQSVDCTEATRSRNTFIRPLAESAEAVRTQKPYSAASSISAAMVLFAILESTSPALHPNGGSYDLLLTLGLIDELPHLISGL